MQLQGLMLILFLIVIPMIALFANHNIFFIVMSFILFVNSANSILSMFLRTNEEHVNTSESLSDELIEELEEVLNIDIRRFDLGIIVSKNLIIILFLIYCSLFVSTILLKAIIAFLAVLSFRNIRQRFISKSASSNQESKSGFSQKILALATNISTMILIVFVAINKIARM